MPDLWQQRKNEMLWEPGVAMQDPALFLQVNTRYQYIFILFNTKLFDC